MPTTRKKKRAALKRALVSVQSGARSGTLSTLNPTYWNLLSAFFRHHAGKLLLDVGRFYPQDPDPDTHDDRDDVVGFALDRLLNKKTKPFDPSRRGANAVGYLFGLVRNAFKHFAQRYLGLRYDREQKSWLRTRHDFSDPINEKTGLPRTEEDIPDAVEPVEEVFVKEETFERLRMATARLEQPAQHLIDEVFFLGRSREDIAKARHVSRSTVSRELAGHIHVLGGIMLTTRV